MSDAMNARTIEFANSAIQRLAGEALHLRMVRTDDGGALLKYHGETVGGVTFVPDYVETVRSIVGDRELIHDVYEPWLHAAGDIRVHSTLLSAMRSLLTKYIQARLLSFTSEPLDLDAEGDML